MVSKSGTQLLPEDAVKTLREELLELTTVFTPNIPEAKLLLQDAGQAVTDPKCLGDIVDIAKRVHALGPQYVLVKGGHLPLEKDRLGLSTERGELVVVNVLCGNDETFLIESDYLNVKNTHGTGCSLACKFRFSSKLANHMHNTD
jgi:ATP-dependent RNA helicase DDX5/DBP2